MPLVVCLYMTSIHYSVCIDLYFVYFCLFKVEFTNLLFHVNFLQRRWDNHFCAQSSVYFVETELEHSVCLQSSLSRKCKSGSCICFPLSHLSAISHLLLSPLTFFFISFFFLFLFYYLYMYSSFLPVCHSHKTLPWFSQTESWAFSLIILDTFTGGLVLGYMFYGAIKVKF